MLALIIDALAPTFNGTKNQIQALKVAAYCSTASWMAGIFALIPGLRFFGILGLYSLYLLYLGLPVLMKSPQGKGDGIHRGGHHRRDRAVHGDRAGGGNVRGGAGGVRALTTGLSENGG